MTKKRTYSLEEAKAFRDKLAELRPDLSEEIKEIARRLQGFLDGMQNASRAAEETVATLREAFRKWGSEELVQNVQRVVEEALTPWADNKDWARKHVVDTARRTLSEVGLDSKIGGSVWDDLGELRNLLARFDALKMEPATRDAANEILEEIIANVCSIGQASNDPHDLDLAAWRRKDAGEKQAAVARQARADKSAAREVAIKGAVEQAMSESKTKPTRGLAYAQHIQPRVQELLDLQVKEGEVRSERASIAARKPPKKKRIEVKDGKVRAVVRVVLKETPGKSGES